MSTASPTGDDWSLTLHSSWKGIMLNAVGALALLAFAIYLLIAVGLNVLTVIGVLVGVGSVVVLALDMPIATTFDELGIERRAALRRHRLSWEQVSRIRRGRAGFIRNRKQNQAGGLVAWIGRRPYVLTDAMESQIEFDLLRSYLGTRRADELGVGSGLRPLRSRPPTWSYRRQHWRPDL